MTHGGFDFWVQLSDGGTTFGRVGAVEFLAAGEPGADLSAAVAEFNAAQEALGSGLRAHVETTRHRRRKIAHLPSR